MLSFKNYAKRTVGSPNLCVAAQVCREAGQGDDECIYSSETWILPSPETLCLNAQLSPLRRDGTARRGAACVGVASEPARRSHPPGTGGGEGRARLDPIVTRPLSTIDSGSFRRICLVVERW